MTVTEVKASKVKPPTKHKNFLVTLKLVSEAGFRFSFHLRELARVRVVAVTNLPSLSSTTREEKEREPGCY